MATFIDFKNFTSWTSVFHYLDPSLPLLKSTHEKLQARVLVNLFHMDSTASLQTNNNISYFLFLVSSSLVKLETIHTVILPPTVRVLLDYTFGFSLVLVTQPPAKMKIAIGIAIDDFNRRLGTVLAPGKFTLIWTAKTFSFEDCEAYFVGQCLLLIKCSMALLTCQVICQNKNSIVFKITSANYL